MSSRREHLLIAQELLELSVEVFRANEDDRRPSGEMDANRIKLLFQEEDQGRPLFPNEPVVLPAISNGSKKIWPKLGLVSPDKTPPRGTPPLEVVSLEVLLYSEGSDHVAFRFEPANNLYFSTKGSHDYYHCQFVTMPRAAVARDHKCQDLPTSYPAFPLRANDFGSLILALMVSLYGINFAATFPQLSERRPIKAKIDAAIEKLGYHQVFAAT